MYLRLRKSVRRPFFIRASFISYSRQPSSISFSSIYSLHFFCFLRSILMALRHFGILLPLVLASLTTAAPKPLNPQPEIPKKFGHTKIYRPLARRDEPPENENGTSPWVIPLQWHPGCDHWRDEDCHDRCHHHVRGASGQAEQIYPLLMT